MEKKISTIIITVKLGKCHCEPLTVSEGTTGEKKGKKSGLQILEKNLPY